MRFRVRKFAHVLERLGLAMAGAASGLFVAALVGSSFALLTSQAFLHIMRLKAAFGFSVGIDTPPLPFHSAGVPVAMMSPAVIGVTIEQFLATFSAFASVG